jgi:hypothetical protein
VRRRAQAADRCALAGQADRRAHQLGRIHRQC